MRVGIIGAGKIGANLARQWSRRGHDILLSYKRDAKQLEALASGLGARWGTPRGAAAHGQVVLLATPWSILDDLADRVSLAVTIVIDATNPFVAGALAQLPADTSAGAANARTVRRLDAGQGIQHVHLSLPSGSRQWRTRASRRHVRQRRRLRCQTNCPDPGAPASNPSIWVDFARCP
jgi:NAD(P)-dependent dehydrogenase (short-subunit alcohol dehydrogenase family)